MLQAYQEAGVSWEEADGFQTQTVEDDGRPGPF